MSKGGSNLAQVLNTHVQSVQQTFQILDKSLDSSFPKLDWSLVIEFGEGISKQATVSGMLWGGETPDIEQLEENLGTYCNALHGFILLCHGTTVGAGPTLHANIRASANKVVGSSLSLLRDAVNSYESNNKVLRSSVQFLAGAVWEMCDALKKTPTTNCVAVGRAITQVAVSIKDVLREMKELEAEDCANSADAGPTEAPPEDDGSTDSDLDDDLSPEEMKVARFIINVVSDALLVTKEVIRFLTGLIKDSGIESNSEIFVAFLESILGLCKEMGGQVNDLGACVYPPQEIDQIMSVVKKMRLVVVGIRERAMGFVESLTEGLSGALEKLDGSLRSLESGMDNNPLPEMAHLAVQCV